MGWKHIAIGAVGGAVIASIAVSITTEAQARKELLARCQGDGGTYILDTSNNSIMKKQSLDCSHYENGHYCRVKTAPGDQKEAISRLTLLGLESPNARSYGANSMRISTDYSVYQMGPTTYKKTINFKGAPLGFKGILDSLLIMAGPAEVDCYSA